MLIIDTVQSYMEHQQQKLIVWNFFNMSHSCPCPFLQFVCIIGHGLIV